MGALYRGYRKALLKRGTFFKLEVYSRVGKIAILVSERLKNSENWLEGGRIGEKKKNGLESELCQTVPNFGNAKHIKSCTL